ncbi:hypothetical protein TRIUR3_14114 [Triticum urartu]|uniref:Uncharacterized protein n=1 Tax=Triticum urartu TaxID=4572 RepID=M7YLE7_TRIUA|nr:hypothetical protein TRIUR3_14114 [Triticum urartu]
MAPYEEQRDGEARSGRNNTEERAREPGLEEIEERSGGCLRVEFGGDEGVGPVRNSRRIFGFGEDPEVGDAGDGRPDQTRNPGYKTSSTMVSPFHLHLDTTHPHPPPSYYSTMDHSKDSYAYGHSVKEVHGGGEHAFFSSDVSTDRDHHHHQHQHHASAGGNGQWQFKQLGGMEPKQHNPTSLFPGYGNNAAYAIDLSSKEEDEEKERRQQQQHCFLLGADLRLDKPSSGHGDSADQKPLRPFFDEWPHEKTGSKGSWMGLEGETQLSISIANELPITTTSRYHHGPPESPSSSSSAFPAAPMAGSEAEQKVVVHVRSAGNAPILKQDKFKDEINS